MGKKGRPLGFRLTETSKRAISESKKGQKHRQTTKDKISRSLILYFRKRNPLSEEMSNSYCRFDEGLSDWFDEYSEELDSYEDILTNKVLRNASLIEMSCSHIIESFSHELTPEIIVMFKETCEEKGMTPDELLSSLGY